jgi:DNA-directed RNA polymerase subunit K/omega
MSKGRKLVHNGINPLVETRNLNKVRANTGNIYESIAIIAKRANQVNLTVKEELHGKLEEFASHIDNLEEISENKEQIEISKFYERMANPALQATSEFLDNKLYYKYDNSDLFS